MAHVYILISEKTGKHYVGSTDLDPKERLREHNAGKTPWTKNHRPLKLMYSETFATEILAQKRERFFKSGRGRMILQSLLKSQN